MRRFLMCLGLCLILISGWMALTAGFVEPAERNIIYAHIPAAICSLVCFSILFICSIQYLRTKSPAWDYTATASAEVGLVSATVLNVTGMIFAYVEWGSWWTPSPRLISSAAMWFLYLAYFLLRAAFAAQRRKETVCAVFGIIAFADVPLVIISARFIRDIHRPSFSFDTGWQMTALGLAVSGTILLAASLIWFRSDILRLKNESNSSGKPAAHPPG